MCGISAIFGEEKDKEAKLKLSLSKIAHRGDPEHQFEYQIFDHAALGVNRLAIVDKQSSKQPQSGEHGEVSVIFNGEIFNFKELTDRLRSLGHTFTTTGDTEVLAHLWEEYREKMVFELDSEMFAFVIFDKKTNEIFAARDRIGVKPLYYAFNKDNTMYLASEIKALVCLNELNEIHEFPPGSYYFKGEFIKYFDIENTQGSAVDKNMFHDLLENAVKKRVQTELPIAVFLSGGVDSSLMMELATRFHKDVTALILGTPDSADYMNAIRLCKEKDWKYKAIEPKIDYEKDLSDIVYFVESYDPNIVRHSFANDAISELAHELGFKVVLTGEGADELFAGYNEFLEMDKSKINLGCKLLLTSMSKGNLMRVDKMAMRYTVEIRCPFFDQKIVAAAMSMDPSLKIGEHDGKQFTKFILRKAAEHYIPEYIAWRDKMPFANGAGMDIGVNYKRADGILGKIAERTVSDEQFKKIQRDAPEYKLETKEEAMLFNLYRSFGYDRFVEGRERLIVKDTLLTV